MKNSINTPIGSEMKRAFNKLLYAASILIVLSTTGCKDNSSNSEKAAKRLSDAETEYRKANKELEEATKRFQEAQEELRDARSDYDNQK